MSSSPDAEKRVAVIGAGPSGCAALRAFQSAKEKGATIPDIACFEKQENWGGLWNYTDRTGVDEYGEPVHNSMYRYLFSNGPKECLEFADYTFEEHFGKPIASYPPRSVLYDYIQGRMNKAVTRDWCRFRTPVRMVQYCPESGQFTITAHDLINDHVYSEKFDWSFPGRVLHAHDFRNALEFKGCDILIVGSSYSAEDIGSQCWKYGARSITLSYRSKPTGFKWPNNWQEVPLLVRLDGNTAHFQDGSCKNVDAIILCTGYQHYFPFLTDDLRLKATNRLWPTGLYKGVVWENNPKLFYLGMQDQFYTFNMFDVQAWFARDVILGRIDLPDKETMRKDSQAWREREDKLETPSDQIWFQGDYVKELLTMSDYPTFDIDAVNRTFEEWEHHKEQDIMGFRDNCYRSAMTGNLAPVHQTPWVDAMDDSMEAYLGSSN